MKKLVFLGSALALAASTIIVPAQAANDTDLSTIKVQLPREICPQNTVKFPEAHLKLNAVLAGRCMLKMFPEIKVIGGWRKHDPYPDHPSGQALDIMMSNVGAKPAASQKAIGDDIALFLATNASQYRVRYIIWSGKLWVFKTDKVSPVAKWRKLSNRGSCTANMCDHIHVTFIGKKPTGGGAWKPSWYPRVEDGKRPVDYRIHLDDPIGERVGITIKD